MLSQQNIITSDSFHYIIILVSGVMIVITGQLFFTFVFKAGLFFKRNPCVVCRGVLQNHTDALIPRSVTTAIHLGRLSMPSASFFAYQNLAEPVTCTSPYPGPVDLLYLASQVTFDHLDRCMGFEQEEQPSK
jgi:hypothetical protein